MSRNINVTKGARADGNPSLNYEFYADESISHNSGEISQETRNRMARFMGRAANNLGRL